MTALRRAAALVNRYILDVAAIVGVVFVAYGLGQYSAPLAPIVIGLGLLLTARFGAD